VETTVAIALGASVQPFTASKPRTMMKVITRKAKLSVILASGANGTRREEATRFPSYRLYRRRQV
jgi:hypothetical protein